MKTPSLHLVDDDGDELSGKVAEAVNRTAAVLFDRYRSYDPAEISNVREESGRVAARALGNGRSISTITGFVFRTALQGMFNRANRAHGLLGVEMRRCVGSVRRPGGTSGRAPHLQTSRETGSRGTADGFSEGLKPGLPRNGFRSARSNRGEQKWPKHSRISPPSFRM